MSNTEEYGIYLLNETQFLPPDIHKDTVHFTQWRDIFLFTLLSLHRTKHQESASGNIAESCENIAETQRLLRDSGNGFKTFTHDSVVAVTAEVDHFLAISVAFPMKETRVFATWKRDVN